MGKPSVNIGRVGVWYGGIDALPTPQAIEAAQQIEELGYGALWVAEAVGRDPRGARIAIVESPRPLGYLAQRRLKMIAAVAAQGFALCGLRDRSTPTQGAQPDQSLEPLLPGFLDRKSTRLNSSH